MHACKHPRVWDISWFYMRTHYLSGEGIAELPHGAFARIEQLNRSADDLFYSIVS